MNVQLTKLSCAYMGGASGPSTIRYISIPDIGLEFSEESIKRLTKNPNELARHYKNSLNEQHMLPEELTEDVHKLNVAYMEFEEAQAIFKKAEEKLSQQRLEFRKTEAGKFIEGLRYPSPKLTLRDILSEEQEARIRNDAEKLGEIKSWTPIKQVYSFVTIEIKFKKEAQPTYGQCVEFKSNGFKCHQVSYEDGPSEKIKTLTLKYEDSKSEAPHIRQDHVEVELYSKLIMYRGDEEKAIKETFGWLKICGYNQAEYEDIIKRVCEYYKEKQATLAPEITTQEIAEALAELENGCDDDDCICAH